MNTKLMTAPGTLTDRPWWSVRSTMLAILATSVVVLVALFSPTPLNRWVFGDTPSEVADW